MIGAWAAVAAAQDYSFPSEPDASLFYPTAYYDHGGVVDWNCGNVTYGGHRGSDFGVGGFAGMDAGRTVTAAAEGMVVYTNDGEFDRCTTGDCAGGSGFGNWVKVQHPDGKYTIYGHLKQWTVAVSVGDPVTCGTVLGEVGSSGFSTGPHLHFEVRNAGNTAEDPFDGPCSSPPTYWVTQGVYNGVPGEVCGPPPECAPLGPLACGDVVVGRNDGPGSTRRTSRYGCDDFVYTGPEQSWELRTPADTPVTLSLTGLAADLDLHVVGSVACDGSDCLAGSSNPDGGDESLALDALGGTPYVVVVDGWEGAVSDYVLTVECPDLPSDTGASPGDTAPPPPPPPPPPTTGDTAAPDGTGSVSGKLPTGSAGCGCGGGLERTGLFVLPFLVGPIRRRRR